MKNLIIIKAFINLLIGLTIAFTPSAYSKIYTFSSSPQKISIIDDGQEAFYLRYQLIKEAKYSINIEYFIFNAKSESTQILLRELIKKAHQGVKVKILLDNFYYNFSGPLSNKLLESGIEVKKYNPALLITVIAQHRNHRKLFSIDGKKAIIGGRNISNEYFDIGESFNFHDRDLSIEGSSVKMMDESFERFWNHKLSKKIKTRKAPRKPSGGNRHNKTTYASRKYKRWLHQSKVVNQYLNEDIAYIDNMSSELLLNGKETSQNNIIYSCEDSLFVTDEPGMIGSKKKDAASYLYKRLKGIQSSVLIETPYFVPRKDEYRIFEKLLRAGKEVSLITNGINGTDAAMISVLFLDRVKFFTKLGMNAYIHGGRNLFNPNDERLWALHNKSFIFDDTDVILGSYNLDPRSKRYNAEMLYECKDNADLVAAMKDKFAYNISESIPITSNGKPAYKEDDSFRYKFKVFSSNTLKHIFKFFDYLL